MSKQEKGTDGAGYIEELAQKIKQVSKVEGLNEDLKKELIAGLIDKAKDTPEYKLAKQNRNKTIKANNEVIKQIGEAYKNLGEDQGLQNGFANKVSKEVGLPKIKKGKDKQESSDCIEKIPGLKVMKEDLKADTKCWIEKVNEDGFKYLENSEGTIRENLEGVFKGTQYFQFKNKNAIIEAEKQGLKLLSLAQWKDILKSYGINYEGKIKDKDKTNYAQFLKDFNIIFGGYSNINGNFNDVGDFACFWCADGEGDNGARGVGFSSDYWYRSRHNNTLFLPARCLKD